MVLDEWKAVLEAASLLNLTTLQIEDITQYPCSVNKASPVSADAQALVSRSQDVSRKLRGVKKDDEAGQALQTAEDLEVSHEQGWPSACVHHTTPAQLTMYAAGSGSGPQGGRCGNPVQGSMRLITDPPRCSGSCHRCV